MNPTQLTADQGAARETVARTAPRRSSIEAIGAVAAIVLAIIGLAGVLSNLVAAVATLIIGAGLLLEGGLAESRYRQSLSSTPALSDSAAEADIPGAFLGGLAGIVLGILALFGIAADTLLAVAVIVFGASVLLSGAAASHLNWLFGFQATPFDANRRGVTAAFGGLLLVGLAAVVLGILAVIGIAALPLVLVGLLCLGAGSLFSGGRMLMPGRA